jgi:thiol-disulfide isomerase/thioredoxin
MRTSSLVAFLAIVYFPGLSAQIQRQLPECETSREVRHLIEHELDSKTLDKMKLPERLAREREVLEGLIVRYPREFEPYQKLVQDVQLEAPDQFPELRDRLVKRATKNPDDPLALLLAGLVLRGKDTPKSIRLLESARSKAPFFPWPAKELAGEYFSGRRADLNKLKQNLEIFFSLCPSSTDHEAQFLLAKDPELQPRVAAALRARLKEETDPKRLEDYSILWGLEFRTRPPAEHGALRAQVARDLERLAKLHPNGNAEWQAFLINGHKQSGASKETVTEMQDRLIHDYPHSNEASDIVQSRWAEAHKEPDDETDTAAWRKHQQEYEKAVKDWMRQYPENTFLQRYAWFYAIQDDDMISEDKGIAAVNAYLQSVKDFDPPGVWMWQYSQAAEFLIRHRWQPTRAIELVKQARASHESEFAPAEEDDNISDDQVKDRNEQTVWAAQYFDGLMLKASKEAGLSDETMGLKASIEAPPPSEKKFQSGYWLNRARFEALQNHVQDALAYYQLALLTRLEPAKWAHGKLRDDLTDEARALWKEQGGSDTAWALWSKPLAGSVEQLAEGRWEKPAKAIPLFELSDLSGRMWQLKDLGGKTLLINVWATWCGPCQAEMPHLQKFYEKIKDRSDVQLLTFNIDEELGLVAPFMKEKGFTFPVLPAFSTVVSLLDGYAIPQNWVIDATGTWRWRQIGWAGETDADFQNEMLEHLQSGKREAP